MVCESIAKREYFVHYAAMRFSDPDTSGSPPRHVGYNACLNHYLALEGRPITRAVAEQRMLEKLTDKALEELRSKKYPDLLRP